MQDDHLDQLLKLLADSAASVGKQLDGLRQTDDATGKLNGKSYSDAGLYHGIHEQLT